jgi:hypothetical protein
MSATVNISDDLRNFGAAAVDSFRRAQVEDIAQAYTRAWQGEIEDLDVIDTGTYLHGVAADYAEEHGGVTTVVIESKPASGYAAAIKRGRGGSYDYVGQRVAEQAIERADGDVVVALDKAGKRIE